MAIGIIGIEIFQTETQGTIRQGEQLTLGNYEITYNSLAEFDTPQMAEMWPARWSVCIRMGNISSDLYPRRDYYYESQQPMTIPGVRSTWEDDLYILLVDWKPISAEGATFKVFVNPLINWLWVGGLVFILGTLVAAWPTFEARTSPGARAPV